MSLPCAWRVWAWRRSTQAIPAARNLTRTSTLPSCLPGIPPACGRSIYLGACCGLVIAARKGKTVYHMGDTAIFSDMGLINEIYRPDIGIVPIGDRFTMGAKTVAMACKRFFLSSRG
jgi:L-ascorbate metabolism protein UlaG (beta-lactamase superfamily)